MCQPATPISDDLHPDFKAGRGLLESINALNTLIFNEFVMTKFSDVETPVGLVLSEKRGVCQDFAHLMLATLRS